jgi:ABC-type dipeptide/oligopeptide/nickel transport system permease subunit
MPAWKSWWRPTWRSLAYPAGAGSANEATLSLLGLGVQAPHASIGLMISNAIEVLNINWTESLFPGLALTVMVLCFSFVGDSLREALDPRSRR